MLALAQGDKKGTFNIWHSCFYMDSTGLVTDTYSYAPYGELMSRTGASDVDYLYNGRDGVIRDDNGLYQMRARYYSPELRRFLNEDEYAGKYDDILNVNLYT